MRLFQQLLGPYEKNLLAQSVPAGFQAVPRTDGSLFIINTTPRPGVVRLSRASSDRLTGRKVATTVELKAFDVVWLE